MLHDTRNVTTTSHRRFRMSLNDIANPWPISLCKTSIRKIGQKYPKKRFSPNFPNRLCNNGTAYAHMVWNGVQVCVWVFPPQIWVLNTSYQKYPRPFSDIVIWPIFEPIFWHISPISGRNSAGNRPKIFFSEKVHETDQKTYLHFFHISHSFFAILLFVFEYS